MQTQPQIGQEGTPGPEAATSGDSLPDWLSLSSIGLRNLAAIIAILGALGVAITPRLTLWLHSYQRWDEVGYRASQLLKEKVELNFTTDNFIPRNDFVMAVKAALDDPKYQTYMVYGQLGSGKSTIIEKALEKEKGVVLHQVGVKDYDATADELEKWWKGLFKGPADDVDFPRDVCSRIEKKSGRALVVVIVVESKVAKETLHSVLRFAKKYGYNTKRARFVVDVSSTRAAWDITSSVKNLRVEQVHVGPLILGEAQSYLLGELPKKWNLNMKQEVTDHIIKEAGCRVLDLSNLCDKMHAGMTTKNALDWVDEYCKENDALAESVLEAFDSFLVKKYKKLSKEIPVLKTSNGELNQDGVKALKRDLTLRGFVEMVADLGHPYVFEIDPFSAKITLGGTDVKRAFKDYKFNH